MKVLVVDTDQISRMVVEQCVSVLGHETLHADNGKHGLAYAKDNNVDLIFMDEEMSDINAPVATKVLRTIKNDDWIPIVYLTNRTEADFYRNGMLAGADAYLQKPLNPSYLQLQITAMERISIMRKKLLAQEALVKANNYLIRLAMIDQITGLGNRRNFEKMLFREFNLAKREKTTLALLMCDLDLFKAYNDTYGHQEGDSCLKHIAEAITETITRPADLACRFGGDEFAVILPRTDLIGSLRIAEKIRQAVYNKDILINDSKDHRVTLSVGLAHFSGQYKNQDELIKAADTALYKAKKKGRNRIEKA
ncbi:MAG: diguanylate cyclase [Methylococcaceae bacterium]|nr:diguanylate cyclase [Methylococcaceae bacterium]